MQFDNDEIALTIFTPTYNRGGVLPRLYSSLLAQNSMRFEWLVVDDGSSDNTGNLFNTWKREAPFTVRYVRQTNSGKHVAHNLGARKAHGRLFMCVDSDDWLEPNAVETVLHDSQALDTKEGLLYPRLFSSKRALDTWFPEGVAYVELSDMRMKYGLVVETAIVFPTAVLQAHPFPAIEGERYMPEGAVYYDLVGEERFLVKDAAFYRCEYLNEGLTRNIWQNWYRNPKSTKLALEKRYRAAVRYHTVRSQFERVAAVINYESLNIATGEDPRRGLPCSNLIGALLLPLAVLFSYKRFGGLRSGE